MILSRTAGRRRRRSRSWRASDVVSRSVGWKSILAKTRIVYCKDDDRPRRYPQERFDFLGYTFRPRRSKNRWGKFFINFTPAVSADAATKMRQEMRRWRLPLRSDKAIDDLARMWNPVLRGWIQYYGRFYRSALYPVFRHLNDLLVRWAMRKYKRLRRHRRRAAHWLGGVARSGAEAVCPLASLGPTAGGRMMGAV